MEIKRDLYLRQLVRNISIPLIKVVTGIRRCGKSYLLQHLFTRFLLEQHHVAPDHIISIDLEITANADLRDASRLNQFVLGKVTDRRPYFVLIDEIQYVPDFYALLNGWLKHGQFNVYVTGSNSHLLASDIATEFRGRSANIQVYPLSFSEFMSQYHGDIQRGWREYLTFGGLPLCTLYTDRQDKISYLNTQKDNVYLNDLIERHGLRNIHVFQALTQIIASDIGALTNPNKIANTFASQHLETSYQTIDNYLRYLSDAFLIEPARRFDIRGRHYIGSTLKYYFTDLGLRGSFLDFRQQEINNLMENVIFLELRRRGYNVDVGMLEIREKNQLGDYVKKQTGIDFIANLGDQKYYIQSAWKLDTPEKVAQEKRSLWQIDNSFKKIIITSDLAQESGHDPDGILWLDIFDFLLDSHSLER
ncbi:ATP-binding protein [bacterium]|nr:ATP-binding protein [bacterium]